MDVGRLVRYLRQVCWRVHKMEQSIIHNLSLAITSLQLSTQPWGKLSSVGDSCQAVYFPSILCFIFLPFPFPFFLFQSIGGPIAKNTGRKLLLLQHRKTRKLQLVCHFATSASLIPTSVSSHLKIIFCTGAVNFSPPSTCVAASALLSGMKSPA